MTALETQSSHAWPVRRWLLLILLITLGQVGCIIWLTGKPLITSRAIPFVPHVFISTDSRAEFPDVTSPTLFVFANRHGFSGPAWLNIPAQEFDLPQWSEAPRPLALSADRLGGDLTNYVRTHLAGGLQLAPPPAPLPDIDFTDDNLGVPQSFVSLEGALADRRLQSPFNLVSWPANDVLTSSVVLAGVDAQGAVFSAVLLQSSGSKDADANAVKLAATARFQAVRWGGLGMPNPAAEKLSWGKIVFHWLTIPAPATNSVLP